MGRMIDHKHARQPRQREDRTPMAKTDYYPIFCSACRIVVLCPVIRAWGVEDTLQPPPPPWIDSDSDYFCSTECKEKGPAETVREHISAHVDFERGAAVSPERQRGRWDALMGYDCIGHRPEYVKGHGEGMDVRAIVDAARAKLEQDRGQIASMPGGSGHSDPLGSSNPPGSPK